jgi:hypothetical protein
MLGFPTTEQSSVVDVFLPAEACWPEPGDSFVRSYEKVIPAEVCAKLREMFAASENKVPGAVGAGTTGTGTVNTKIKSSLDLDVALEGPEWMETIGALRDAVGEAVSRYANEITSLHLIQSEYGIVSTGLQLQSYEPNGKDRFVVHIDRASLASCHRELGVILYLNDVEMGGETCFPVQRLAIKPEEGKVVVFPAGFTHPHEGRTPITGPKLIATAFMCHATPEQEEEAKNQIQEGWKE